MLHRRRRRLLLVLGRCRRPFAWAAMIGGFLGLILTFPFGITSQWGDESFWATVLGFVLTFLAGWEMVMDVEFTDDDDPTNPDFPEG